MISREGSGELRPRRRPPREPARERRLRLVSAGHILGVGLLCFGLWLLFDARQLYNSANSAPLGVRRSVAMSVLRPIARVTSALSLDRIVDGADDALGRTVGSTVASGHPQSGQKTGHVHHHHTSKPSVTGTTTPPTTVPPTGPAALVQPTPKHPMTVLEVGDSLGEDLGYGLGNVIGSNPSVNLIQDAVQDTGLANVAYYNWPAELQKELNEYHPQLVIVMLGGNDTQNFLVGNQVATFGTTFWAEQYGDRVHQMMAEATADGAHVAWVGMPIMQSTSFTDDMVALDDEFEVEAAGFPDVTYVSTWKAFENDRGQYSEYLPNAQGDLEEVRDTDGVHIADPGGDDLVATTTLQAIADEWGITLAPGIHAPPPPGTTHP